MLGFNSFLAIASGLIVYFLLLTEYKRYFSIDMTPSVQDHFQFNNLSKPLQNWHSQGSTITINNIKMFYIYEKMSHEKNYTTLIFIHGFPTSSYDYNKALNNIKSLGYPFLLFDHAGFGLSEKPSTGFSYSIMEHADQAIGLWKLLGIKRAFLIAHDMGDTVLTEVLARKQRDLLPSHFDDFFQGVIFTNGGMLFEHIKFRLAQILLLHPVMGPYTVKLMNSELLRSFSDYFSYLQLKSVWSPDADAKSRDADILAIQELNRYNGGNFLMHKTILYLLDRYRFEHRYLAAVKSLSMTNTPCSLIWGDKDAVSPPQMMTSLSQILSNCNASFITGLGHFPMLENVDLWTVAVKKAILNSLRNS